MTWMRNIVWTLLVLGALWLMGTGLADGFSIEPTEEELARAAHGARLVTFASVLLVAAALYASYDGRPRWVAAGLLVPVVLCGGFTWFAPETALALLAVVVAYPAAIAAAAGGLRRRA